MTLLSLLLNCVSIPLGLNMIRMEIKLARSSPLRHTRRVLTLIGDGIMADEIPSHYRICVEILVKRGRLSARAIGHDTPPQWWIAPNTDRLTP